MSLGGTRGVTQLCRLPPLPCSLGILYLLSYRYFVPVGESEGEHAIWG